MVHCTRCSELVKPVVCIDIDGTLGDYHSHFLEFASNWLDTPFSENLMYDGEDRFRNWFCKTFYVDVTTFRQIKLAYRQGGMKRTMPVYDQANTICHTVRAVGAELWLTTTRPYLSLDGIDRDTRAWLERNDIEYDRLLYDENKYAVVSERVSPERVVAVLDDEQEQCAIAGDIWNSNVPVQRGTKYNEGATFGLRAEHLTTAQNLIVKRIRGWKEHHG